MGTLAEDLGALSGNPIKGAVRKDINLGKIAEVCMIPRD
jgi:hypothetical protein